jgi:hypothetical protein
LENNAKKMKFLLREYLGMLKEDKELDVLVTDLLFNMGILPLTKPRRGRQHGVDISAVGVDPEDGKKKVFLMVIKQGDFTRSTWNKDVNSIRPTLDEVRDVYIKDLIPKRYSKLKTKIVVSSNGELDANVNQNWSAYTRQHTKKNLEFDFWGKDKLVQLLNDYSISEQMLPESDRMLLRKTLSFLDLSDYDLRHFYQLTSDILARKTSSSKTVIKKIRLVALCLNILFRWSEDMNNLKPAVLASERIVLMLWDWLRKKKLLDDKDFMQEFYKVHTLKSEIGKLYFVKIQNHSYVQDSLYSYARTHTEYALLTWEHIGLISIAGLTEIFNAQLHQGAESEEQILQRKKNAEAIANGLVNMINHNLSSTSVKYDEHCIEFSLAAILMVNTDNLDFLRGWMKAIIGGLRDAYRFNKFFPLFHTSYDKLLSIELGEEQAGVTSSIFLTILADWACMLDDNELYQKVRNLARNELKGVDLQLWFPENDIEESLYSKNAMKTGSTLHSIELPEDIEMYKKDMRYELEHFSVEKETTIIKYGFYYLGYVASRHFRTYPLPFFCRAFLK